MDAYPVGSIYITVNPNFNPGTAWGGTWVSIGSGRCLWGAENSDLGNDLSGILPNHKHSVNIDIAGSDTGDPNKDDAPLDPGKNIAHTYHATSENPSSSSLPSGITAGNTLRPPSVGVKFWKRTA